VYPRANKAKNLPPTSTNPNFNYVVSQPVNKQEIGLNYEAEFYSGYIPVDNQGSYIFYHVYPSNGANNANANLENNDPLILWMQGGPGCSDWIGAMIEHGPFTIIMNSEGQPVPVLTNINWNQCYNLLYVD
jgi:carboxypeptidase C (cathepsin A)